MPGTVYTNTGQPMIPMNTHPYPGDEALPECDNCQQSINPAMGLYHGQAEEVDLCKACGE